MMRSALSCFQSEGRAEQSCGHRETAAQPGTEQPKGQTRGKEQEWG